MKISSFSVSPTPISAEANRRAAASRHLLTGRERTCPPGEVIVSKTDTKGLITYANTALLDISGYGEHELLGAPHSVFRHPEMPRSIFRLLWSTIQSGEEVFAYVVNRAKNGDHYWVFAHVTPTVDRQGRIIGYHSNRRTAAPHAIARIKPLYGLLNETEKRFDTAPEAAEAGLRALMSHIDDSKMTYGEFIFSL